MPVKTSSPFFLFPPERTLYSKFRATNLRLSNQINNVLFVSTTSTVTQTTVLADFLTSRKCVLIISTQCATKHPFFQILKKELVPLQNRVEKQCFLGIVQMPFTVLCRHLCFAFVTLYFDPFLTIYDKAPLFSDPEKRVCTVAKSIGEAMFFDCRTKTFMVLG